MCEEQGVSLSSEVDNSLFFWSVKQYSNKAIYKSISSRSSERAPRMLEGRKMMISNVPRQAPGCCKLATC